MGNLSDLYAAGLDRLRFPAPTASPAPGFVKKVFWVASLDLGQQSDPSALALLRVERREQDGRRLHYLDCPFLRRWPLKTAYPDIVDEVTRLFETPDLQKQTLLLDATGVGRGVLDMFRRARPKAKIIPITIVGGHQVLEDGAGGWHVPKKDLVGAVQMILGTKRFGSEERLLRVADQEPLGKVLLDELATFTAKINVATGNVTLEAWRDRDHDDIVLAVAMAAWWVTHFRTFNMA